MEGPIKKTPVNNFYSKHDYTYSGSERRKNCARGAFGRPTCEVCVYTEQKEAIISFRSDSDMTLVKKGLK